jgi:hypothetical protein
MDKMEISTTTRDAMTVINREATGRLPFITRLETWYKSHQRTATLPERYAALSLPELHREVGVGQLKFATPYAFKLKGVQVNMWLDGGLVLQEYEPLVENFPGIWDLISTEKAGSTLTEFTTPVGKLCLKHQLLEENVVTGTDPILKEHLIKDQQDFRTVAYILERVEYVPLYDKCHRLQQELGEIAWVVPLLHRIPFQQVLLEYLGETSLFYSLYDNLELVDRLLALLDDQLTDILFRLGDFKVPYVEFPDNLHGLMTNPRLFKKYCLPHYQKYTEILHSQGKKVGSHMDGELKQLLGLITETGLDVCESFSPFPLTSCLLEEARQAWQNGPIIWGGIPSTLLEYRTSQSEFEDRIAQILELVKEGPFILGVVDLFMRHNSIERVRYIATRL